MQEKDKGLIESLLDTVRDLSKTIDDLGRILSGEVKDDKTSQEIIDQAIDKTNFKEKSQ